ncbi:GNAT family N-acetyltransferase [Flavihumibacter fluvii]|uniref:GNAT family N-acetyltransferase n=1 Tax=Flavihumibacter fluvii TaxID=2838157 RepID=UPI001BDDEED2|nr:GNAT family N-acetyltransferase [Flavihumibacter fluvii]ULQ51665.1 GNAT family N-acetyltransferase [Flavihumibacter fluvii]
MKNQITIRPASLDDLQSVAYLFDQYRQYYKQPTDLDGAEEFLRDRIEQKESVILVALESGEIIGFTQLYPIFSSISMRKAWLLNDLYVSEGQRGKGAGTQLLDAAKDVGRNSGAKWLMLQTTADNARAQSVYEKNGWVRESDWFYQFDL